MKKDIWIFNHYATSMFKNKGGRHYSLALELKKRGYNPTIFCANTLHNSLEKVNNIKNDNYYIEELNGVKFVFIDTVPSCKNNIQRVKNMFKFYYNLNNQYKRIMDSVGAPDIIYASSVHPLTLVSGIKISKKLNIPCISEIRDLWPEAIFEFTKIKEKGFIGSLLVKGEHWIYKKSDSLIFTKEGDTDYLKEKGWFETQGGKIDAEKCYYINNGVDIHDFDNNSSRNTIEDEDLHSDKFNIVYSGAIRPVNDVSKLVRIARLLREHDDIQILIYGSGNDFERIDNMIKEFNLNNIILKGSVEKKYIPYILKNSNLNILNYSQEKFNWSRGNSSNKLFEYFASGKPIISTVKMGYSPIKKYNCGYEFFGDSNEKEITNKILEVKEMYDKDISRYNELCNNSIMASKEFDYYVLCDKLIDVIENTNRS
ncbi:glycosyltransferase family 4 protein [Vagococcus sp. CY53-2]|uniref:glycosyltransferase family 4 protein n=1 Tax=Vagococcus sp. CY53-2 TaxID=2925780 RepID=UPI001F51457F|nr:glycosyltransferase family 4 protein [Vagococcus sp. CY53-2]MCI0130539.1 glycosyltransferase family 4 protein [Vagococcus sp. CY53-2]